MSPTKVIVPVKGRFQLNHNGATEINLGEPFVLSVAFQAPSNFTVRVAGDAAGDIGLTMNPDVALYFDRVWLSENIRPRFLGFVGSPGKSVIP